MPPYSEEEKRLIQELNELLSGENGAPTPIPWTKDQPVESGIKLTVLTSLKSRATDLLEQLVKESKKVKGAEDRTNRFARMLDVWQHVSDIKPVIYNNLKDRDGKLTPYFSGPHRDATPHDWKVSDSKRGIEFFKTKDFLWFVHAFAADIVKEELAVRLQIAEEKLAKETKEFPAATTDTPSLGADKGAKQINKTALTFDDDITYGNRNNPKGFELDKEKVPPSLQPSSTVKAESDSSEPRRRSFSLTNPFGRKKI